MVSELGWLAINKQLQSSIYYMLININETEKRPRSFYILTFFFVNIKTRSVSFSCYFLCMCPLNLQHEFPKAFFLFASENFFLLTFTFCGFYNTPKAIRNFSFFLPPTKIHFRVCWPITNSFYYFIDKRLKQKLE